MKAAPKIAKPLQLLATGIVAANADFKAFDLVDIAGLNMPEFYKYVIKMLHAGDQDLS